MNSNKILLVVSTLILLSISANVYFAYKVFGNDVKPDIRTVTVDEPIIIRTKGGLLEVSSIIATELFETSEFHTVLGLHLATTIARIRVPAVYRYHIELAPEWKIELRDKTFIVITPPVKPSLPVAIDTAHLEAESLGAWSLFTGTGVLDPLQRSITRALATKAITSRYIDIQRETGRKTVTEFVEKWLITQKSLKLASGYQVRVFFADEPIQVLESIPQSFVSPHYH